MGSFVVSFITVITFRATVSRFAITITGVIASGIRNSPNGRTLTSYELNNIFSKWNILVYLTFAVRKAKVSKLTGITFFGSDQTFTVTITSHRITFAILASISITMAGFARWKVEIISFAFIANFAFNF